MITQELYEYKSRRQLQADINKHLLGPSMEGTTTLLMLFLVERCVTIQYFPVKAFGCIRQHSAFRMDSVLVCASDRASATGLSYSQYFPLQYVA